MEKTTLTGRVGLVTGAGAGIGEACAILLAEKGALVVVSDVNLAAANRVVNVIAANGGKAIASLCDVSKPEQVADLMKAAINEFGRLDFAVNNAGVVGKQIPLQEYKHDDWERIIAVNLGGTFYCMQEELKIFYAQGHGAIVNIASEASLKGSAADAVYTASKHGVAGLTKTVALEAAKKGVRVNAVCPGSIETQLVKDFTAGSPELYEFGKNLMPVGRYGQPSEIAEAVAWLCSDAASLMSGHLMAVDGAWSAS